jgi:hypothetical protein
VSEIRVCKGCQKSLVLTGENFYRNYKSRGGFLGKCKKCSPKPNNELRRLRRRKGGQREEYLKYVAKYGETARFKAKSILTSMRRRSKEKGFDRPEFTVVEIAKIIENGRCVKTGIPFQFSKTEFHSNPWTPTPDRIDSKKGYTKENVQWVCFMYNALKGQYTEELVAKFIEAYCNINTSQD